MFRRKRKPRQITIKVELRVPATSKAPVARWQVNVGEGDTVKIDLDEA